jgi:hypothetical protein
MVLSVIIITILLLNWSSHDCRTQIAGFIINQSFISVKNCLLRTEYE